MGRSASAGAHDSPQKNLFAGTILPCRTRRPPFFWKGSVGTKVKKPRNQYFTTRSTTQRLLSKKTARMGDKAKALVFVGRRLCCVKSAFLCWPSLRKTSIRDQMRMRLTSKAGGVIVPHT